ncbi:MAG: hypothetical protein H6831_03610 [Planctomycetes bacterium]|nr:hypothetical protein [Planctomycetota bacterium]MCB9903472.1 hypothetical protein [Planctomycetota bacterium]
MNGLARRLLLCLPLLLLGAASCGYSSGLRAPEGYQSVGVAIFANDSKVPDLERDLHRFVSTSVRDAVEAPLTSPQLADVVIEGRILDYAHFGGIRGPNNELLETGVSISVESWLVDRATGERIGEAVYSGQTVGYTTVEFGGEERSKDRSLAYLAEGLVLELFARHSH